VASLAPRPVTLLSLRSPLGTPVFKRAVQAEYEYAEAAYAAIGASEKLRIDLRREIEGIAAFLPAAPATTR
jgi:hypothetical protein